MVYIVSLRHWYIEHFKKVLPTPIMFLCVLMFWSYIELVGRLNGAKSSCFVLIFNGLFSVSKWCRPSREYWLVCYTKAE